MALFLMSLCVHKRYPTMLFLNGGQGRIRTYNVSYVADLQSVAFNQFSALVHVLIIHSQAMPVNRCSGGNESVY